MSRFRTAALAAVASLLVLAGCSTGPSGGDGAAAPGTAGAGATGADPAAYPITLKDAFGEATITKPPTRVVTLGWSDADHVAALGVAPVGAPKVTWGGNVNLSTDWFDKQIATFGGAQPTRFDDADGNPIEEIAGLQPDLILATNSGITKEEYEKLSKLAPGRRLPRGRLWHAVAGVARDDRQGARSQRPGEAGGGLDPRGTDRCEGDLPQLAGKTFIYGYIAPTDLSQIGYYTPSDLRPQMLTELGLTNAPVVEAGAKGSKEFYLTVSSERAASMESDIFLIVDLVGRGRHPHHSLVRRWSDADDDAVARAMRATDTLGLAERHVEELSGGQRQRVWIALTLAQDTDVILLDEPTTYLDVAHQIDVLDLLVDLNRRHGTTIVMVLHDLNLAARYADHVIALREGALVAAGRPADVVTEAFVRSVFGLESTVIADPVVGSPRVVPASRDHLIGASS